MSITLQPAFVIDLVLQPGGTAHTSSAGQLGKYTLLNGLAQFSLTLVDVINVTGGTVKSFGDNEYVFDGEITGGRDDITISSKGTHSNLDCRLFGKLPGGAGFSVHYNGVIQLNAAIGAVLTGKATEIAFEDGLVVSQPYVTLDKDADAKYQWVETHALTGRGRFYTGSDGLHIVYNVYAAVL